MCSEVITKRTGKIIKIALISNFGAVKLGNANNGALITVEKSTVIFYLSLRNRATLEKLILTNAKKEKIFHQEKLLEKYTNEQFKCMNKIN